MSFSWTMAELGFVLFKLTHICLEPALKKKSATKHLPI